MNRLIISIALGTAVAACDNSDHTIVADPIDDGFNAAEQNVVLPPAIKSSKTYRCADNTIVHIDWLADGRTATLRVGDSGAPVSVASAEAGKPMSAADGTSIEGTAEASSARVTLPGKSAQSCKA